jgi:hypothetical protein
MSPSPAADANPSDGHGATQPEGGPVLQLLARALKLWVRQQCEAIGSLEIRLEGSTLALLKGRLAGVRVLARRVEYQGLRIELVEMHSEPIEVQMGRVLLGRGPQLEHPFQIRGQLSFTAEGLTRSLACGQWRGLGDGIGEALLGISPLTEVRVRANRLVLAARGVGERGLIELTTQVGAADGSLEIRATEAPAAEAARYLLPMDPNITITRAEIEAGMLQLHGEARVTP